MPVIDTFAKRMERARNAGKPVIYEYDELSERFRVQAVHTLNDLIDQTKSYLWYEIHSVFIREVGVFDLVDGYHRRHADDQCRMFILDNEDVDQVLSLVEIAFSLVGDFVESHPHSLDGWGSSQNNCLILKDAISTLNQRFRENEIGYQYESRQIVRVDSQYLHAEAVEPAVSILYDAGFAGALDEFLQAHKHYREGKNKEAISSAFNAFESVMKTICDKREWEYDAQKATAGALIKTLFDNGLIPSEMQSHFTGLRVVLESGVPTIRNNFAGHGQGSEPVEVPDHLVSYALHLTASNIVFLVEAYNALD